jgi:Uncharacterised nucleotidyltransferase
MTVKQTPAEAIVGFLSFSGVSNSSVCTIEQFSIRGWERVLQWLDDTGLSFYFLEQLKRTKHTAIVPSSVLSRLEHNFASNQRRVDSMALRFNEINKQFDHAGVRYEVVKGFSLVPEFCPYASLRYQADFDYLVAHDSLPAARRVLTDAGYNSRGSLSEKESVFVTPGAKACRGGAQYSPQSPHAVELHTDIWDNDMHDVWPIPRLFSVDQAKMRHWNDSFFPAQRDEDAFLLQILHACRHLFTQWIRVSNLFEIAYFLNRRSSDNQLWGKISGRIGQNMIVRDFVVIVAEIASRLFATPLPPLLQDWGASIPRKPRVWIEHYARDWALSELPVYGTLSLFPRSKLVLFLQREYRAIPSKTASRRGHSSISLRLSQTISSVELKPSLLLSYRWWKNNQLFRRAVFCALAQARYLVEIPRWRWLTRTPPLSASGRHLLPSNNSSSA